MFTVLSVKIEMKKILNKKKNNLPALVTFLRPTDKESDNYSEFLSLCHKLSTLSVFYHEKRRNDNWDEWQQQLCCC